ncbi:hypothetical protein MNBD_GAMMA09-1138 [hydrothermal vent metagenome]|uniref:Uncharacterized protein n=1 Tax=hydrothermal vent metagenome TaxID=652676 RepID=A0A3B0XPS4_9ZZZZ
MHLFIVRENNRSGFINVTGDIIKPQFLAVGEFHNDLVRASTESNGKNLSACINASGDWVIEPRFSYF